MRAACLAFVLVVLLLLAGPGPGGATPPVTHDACADAPDMSAFLSWDTQLENLAFDGTGRLFVSDLGGDRILSIRPDGTHEVVLQTDGVHGMTIGLDGHLYIGAQRPGSAGDPGDWEVWRATDATATAYTTYATGLPASNGMAFDDAGNLFVSNPLGTSAPYLVRVPADAPLAWTAWDDRYGPNGLWFDDATGTMVAAITGDQSSPIVRVDTTEPRMEAIATLSAGAVTLQPGIHEPEGVGGPLVPKGLDDLTIGADGMIYVAAHVTGEVLRVDPSTGDACVLAAGLLEPTSLRFAHGFGDHDGDLFVTDMGGVAVTALFGPGAGTVWRIDLA